MSKKVLIAAPVHQVLIDVLLLQGYAIDTQLAIEQQDLLPKLPQYEGIVTSNRLDINAAFLDAATGLKWIGRMGSGMEIVDVPHAEKKGIVCASSPEGNANAVAEQALGMLLLLKNKLHTAFDEIKQGLWQREENRGTEIEGLTAGIVGYGNNGSAFARKLRGMGVEVLALDKYKTGFGEQGICESTMDEIAYRADILSFHLPLTDETLHYFDEQLLAKMRKPFVLLNLSRGKIVNQSTLLAGMREGKITAAALDVWEQEPIAKMEGKAQLEVWELLQMPNFAGTPHIAGYTVEALYKMSWWLAFKLGKDLGWQLPAHFLDKRK
ncbi:MAG: NAD(P)-dependent oxidoreductase [Edaphocola sp.]